jgi:hypothetical protein
MPALIKALDEGYDMAIGSRFKGKMAKGAMSFSHRYIGNPILTTILNLFFKSHISDAHSGFRAIKRVVLIGLGLRTTGMEFASEMIVAALREKIKIKELPITYHPRIGESKLNPFPDAWRHIRFMLLFSPTWLFVVPGLILFLGGFICLVLTALGQLVFLGHAFDLHAMILFIFCALLGFQIVNLGLFAKTFSWLEAFVKKDKILDKFYGKLNLEKGIVVGFCVFMVGFLPSLRILINWIASGFGPLNDTKIALIGLFLMVIGIQVVFSSFFLSLLGMPRKYKQ